MAASRRAKPQRAKKRAKPSKPQPQRARVLDPAHPITAFFSDRSEQVLASLPAMEASSGAVTKLETLWRNPKDGELRPERGGIFCQKIFGPMRSLECLCGAVSGASNAGATCERCGVLCGDPALRATRFGHIETGTVVHPAAYGALVEALQLDTPDIRAIARGEKLLRGETLIAADPLAFEDGDLTGPDGLAEVVRRARPDHPLLPMCALMRVPIPPPAARPFRSCTTPEEVDGWIGPLNEAWLELIERANRRDRLIELDAPPIIQRNEAALTQCAFEAVIDATTRAEARLVPALAGAPEGSESRVLAIAFAGPKQLLIQHDDATRVIDLRGREVFRGPPAGCLLRGVVDGRYAVFQGYLDGLHPFVLQDTSVWPTTFLQEDGAMPASPIGELSVLDLDTGSFLANAPEEVPLSFVFNDQPEDLFVGEAGHARRLRVGGDRPSVIAYSHDLRFAWVGGDSSNEIIRISTGLPVAYPGEARSGERTLDLLDGKSRKSDEDDDDGEYGAAAITFFKGRWVVLSGYGVLTDHRITEPLRLSPVPSAAAFDPAGARLALVVADKLVIVDPVARKVVARASL